MDVVSGEVIATLGFGVCDAGLMLLAATRNTGGLRRGAAATGLVYGLWTAGSVGLLVGMPAVLFWAGLRPVIVVLLSLATAQSPGVVRSGRDLFEVIADGWVTVGGFFGLVWIVVKYQSVFPDRAAMNPQMLWLIGQILLMSLVAGLFARAVPGRRGPPLVAYLVGLTVLVGDVLALVTGDARLGIAFWLGSGLLMAVSFLVGGGELFTETVLDPDRPRRIHLWQLPVPYLVAYLVVPVHHDRVMDLTTIGLAAALTYQLFAYSAGNERLWVRLAERTRLYQGLLQDSQDMIVQVDGRGGIQFANDATRRVLSLDPEKLIGTKLRDYAHPDDRHAALEKTGHIDWSTQDSTRVLIRYPAPPSADGETDGESGTARWRHVEWVVSRSAAPPVPIGPAEHPLVASAGEAGIETGIGGEDGAVTPGVVGIPGWILVGRDVSERIRLQHELSETARLDTLTGLLNRGAFLAAVADRLEAQTSGGAAVLFIDLDKFKAVNDTLGHDAGDRLLCRAAECLRQATGQQDAVGRLGGDEFAVLSASSFPADVMTVAEAVISAFNAFDTAALGRPPVSASVGMAIASTGTALELLRDADLAMYRAKLRGGAAAVLFEPWMSQRVLERSRLRADLESAVRAEALTLHLQPVVELETARWAGFEALVRWPVGGQTWSPDQFLPVAEESGLIVPMGAWVLREALRQLADWRNENSSMAVNVSAQQLVGTDLFDVVMGALEAADIAPERLTLEITEQAAVQDLGRTASRLSALRSEGVHVAIDDFGTGYSSMQYLARLPVDILKIDKKFVSGLGREAEDDVLVRSMIGLADELGLDVIAEGVETRQQADRLIAYGCRLAQGFLFSPPRPFADLRRIRADVGPKTRPVPPMRPALERAALDRAAAAAESTTATQAGADAPGKSG